MTHTLYVYGNGEFIYDLLMSANMFMAHARGFFEVGALISLMAFAIEATGIMPSRGYDWMRFMRVYFLITVFILTPSPGTVTVTDLINNENYVYNVNNSKLPIGLVVPMTMASTVVYKLIQLYQQNYEIDSSLNYSYSGMNFGANFIQSLDSANSYDDTFNFNLDNFMQNCGFPLLNKSGALGQLRSSQDIFKTLTDYASSTSRFVQQKDFATGNPVIKTCKDSIADINSYYNNNAEKFMNKDAQMMGISTGQGLMRFMTSANATAVNLLNISQGASAALKQAIGMNMIMTSLKNGSQSTGNGTLALAAYDAEQFQQYKKSGELSGSAAARTIPILVGAAFALLIILYPIMIFLAVAAGSYKAMGVFFQVLVTVNLIPLMYEVINYISTFYLQKKLGIVINGGSIYSYDMSTSLYSFTDNMIVAGNYLASATPLLAYALVSGSSMALTSVFGHINDPAKQKAMQDGDDLAKGNQNIGGASIDNASFNNLQGNKLDNQMLMNTGSPIMKNTTPGGIQTDIAGQDYFQNYKSDLLAKPDLTQTASHMLQNSLSNTSETMAQQGKQWSQQSQRLHDLSNSISSGENHNISAGSETAKAIQKAETLSTQIAATLTTPGKSFFGGIDGSVNSQASSELSNNLREYSSIQNQLSHSLDSRTSDTFQKSSSLAANSSETVQQAVATSHAMSDINSRQSSLNTNFSNDFANHLVSKGLDPNNMNALEQNSEAEHFVKDKLNSMYGIKDNLTTPTTDTSSIHGLGNSHASNDVNASGIDVPPIEDTSITIRGNQISTHANHEMANFENHPEKVVASEMLKQAQTGYNVVKNTAGAVTQATGVDKAMDGATEKLSHGMEVTANKVEQTAKAVTPSTETKKGVRDFADSYLGNDKK